LSSDAINRNGEKDSRLRMPWEARIYQEAMPKSLLAFDMLSNDDFRWEADLMSCQHLLAKGLCYLWGV